MTESTGRRRPLVSGSVLGFGIFALFAACGTVALYGQAKPAGKVNTADGVKEVLDQIVNDPQADVGGEIETFLLVGSDSREGVDKEASDFGGIGEVQDSEGKRSDSIMLLRHNVETGDAALLSIPRDLWVYVPALGQKERVNTAFSISSAALVETLQTSLSLTINHFVEVNFEGFKSLVDAIGGVTVCFNYPSRDLATGLFIAEHGCPLLTGVQALQYTRSRHFEQLIDGVWVEDPRSDIGRMDRQQEFILGAVNQAQGKLGENPAFLTADLFDAAKESLTVDEGVDLFDLRARFAGLASEKLQRYTLPTSPKRIDGKDVLILDEDAAFPVLSFFRGLAEAPQPVDPVVPEE